METYTTYADMREKVGELYQQEEYVQAAEILAGGLNQFPDKLLANAYNLAACQAQLGQAEKAVETLLYGLDHGIWYGQWDFELEVWMPLKELAGFQSVLSRSMECQREAHKVSKPELVVVPPAGYDPGRKYPLFIALHGGGETAAGFQEFWTSPRLVSDFIVAYPQSSRPVSMRGFSWVGDDLDRQEILAVYQSVLKEYSVDTGRIIMGGFSAGGHLTLTLLLDEHEILPVRGFIVLCPPVPDAYPPDAVARIRARGQKGLLLTTELDNRLDEQRSLAKAFEEGGVAFQFIVTPNIEHWFPPDFAQRIDAAIDDILS
jgi:predicted esterase